MLSDPQNLARNEIRSILGPHVFSELLTPDDIAGEIELLHFEHRKLSAIQFLLREKVPVDLLCRGFRVPKIYLAGRLHLGSSLCWIAVLGRRRYARWSPALLPGPELQADDLVRAAVMEDEDEVPPRVWCRCVDVRTGVVLEYYLQPDLVERRGVYRIEDGPRKPPRRIR